MKENLKTLSSSDKMTNEISALSLVESFLDEYYFFRRNVLSGKTEYFTLSKNEDETEEPVEEEPETGGEEEESSDSTWKVLTPEAFNSIVRHAKRLGVGGKKSPRQDIEEFVHSEEVPEFDPIREYLENLPEWDGKNHVAELFGRIPGLTSEQLDGAPPGSVRLSPTGCRWICFMATKPLLCLSASRVAARVPLPIACCRTICDCISSTTSTLPISLIPRWRSLIISLST